MFGALRVNRVILSLGVACTDIMSRGIKPEYFEIAAVLPLCFSLCFMQLIMFWHAPACLYIQVLFINIYIIGAKLSVNLFYKYAT